ncbi:hypothetical protein [Streptomyces sp. MZ04]|uniref:hypothetical protein n=1 Tax=Streptomyces sp. MZ04 TaxID=2559236 RepID=UPI00107E6F15|nr:hypothetical protein [Streptomyces sp. MZ04]TGB09788.1 hypothetical protein E2651_15675 [Streptomyces sp. MZ04]
MSALEYLDQPVVVAEPCDGPHATLTMQAVVSRDQLAALVEMGGSSFEAWSRHPDEWPVELVRAFAESYMVSCDTLTIQMRAESIARLAEDGDPSDPSVQPLMQAVYRAVDRAYPQPAGSPREA